MKRALALAVLCVAARASAGETATVPAGAFVLDASYLQSNLDKRWNDDRQGAPLIDAIDRYEPGGGKQGTLTAAPTVKYQLLITQLYYGITDNLMAAVGVPLVLKTHIQTNLGWVPGDYQPTLGRAYSQDDFWQWAASMGQQKPPDSWTGNKDTFADLIVGGRYRLPQLAPLHAAGLQWATTLLVALPTGHAPDPEELVAAGTTTWDLHSYGDGELHLAFDRPFIFDGISRLNIGGEAYYAYFRKRTYTTPKGTKYPLLMNNEPYVGDTYTLDPGDWVVGSVYAEAAPIVGPTRASFVSGGSLETANAFPPLLNVQAGYTYIHCFPSIWKSDSAQWDYQHDLPWRDGDKNMLKFTVTVSLLRVGLPLQLYGSYRNQSLIPGKNTRAADSAVGGVRVIAKFW